MDWQQVSCKDSPSTDDDAASDGDIDIAFSLLLAHKQWGSEGIIN
jgi:endo-1,4-beta-D-glucanase Y